MPFTNNENPWSAWVSRHVPNTFAHPDSPAGGSGYGRGRVPGPNGVGFYSCDAPDPGSPEGRRISGAQAAVKYAEFELERARHRIRRAYSWDTLRPLVYNALGRQSFGLGACYGIVKNPVMTVVGLVELKKMLIEADLYDRMTGRVSWRTQLSMTWMTSLPELAMVSHYLMQSMGFRMGMDDLKRSWEMREALIKEVGEIFAHPGEFFEKLKEQTKTEAIAKWVRFCELQKQTDLKSQFEAGAIFGDVLMEVVMLVLTVVSAVGAARQAAAQAAKLAARCPQLVRVAKFIKSARAAETGAVVAEAGEAAEGVKATAKALETAPKKKVDVPKIEVTTPKTPFAANLYKIDANGTKAVRIRQGTNGKVAVIGRDMNTVRPYAAELKAKGYEVEIFDGKAVPKAAMEDWNALKAKYAPEYIPDSEVTKCKLFEANKEWAKKLVGDGYTVTDIGSAPGSTISPFYEIEKEVIF